MTSTSWLCVYAGSSALWGLGVLWHWEYLKAKGEAGSWNEVNHLSAATAGCLFPPLAMATVLVVLVGRATGGIPRILARRALTRETRKLELQAMQKSDQLAAAVALKELDLQLEREKGSKIS